jgi:hypothetical protein
MFIVKFLVRIIMCVICEFVTLNELNNEFVSLNELNSLNELTNFAIAKLMKNHLSVLFRQARRRYSECILN